MAVINGTPASETLLGTAAADTITGAGGNDTITGAGGNDKVLMGTGNDLFIWNPDDGYDTIDGGVGNDTIRFTGSDVPEPFEIAAVVGGGVRIIRLVDNVVDLDAVERIELQARGGADTIEIDDFAGTDLKQVAIDLSMGTPGVGDGAVDKVTAYAADGNNTITITQAGGLISATGLPIQITLAAAEVDNDYFEIRSLEGNDKISAATLPKALILTLDGGVGNDSITGSAGNDSLEGGDGNDTVTGGRGNDFANLADGNDLFVANAGDGEDEVFGGNGIDTLRFIGNGANETFNITYNGGPAFLTHDTADAIALDDVERVEFRPLGGEDLVNISTLAGTDVTAVVVDLAATSGGAVSDKKFDEVNVDGTGLDNSIKVASVGVQVVVSGLSAQVSVGHADKTDILNIFGFNGNDTIDASKLAAGKLALQLFGGLGADTLIGGAGGNDFVDGGEGNDFALLGAGNDFFAWSPGDGSDKIEGQAGIDTLQFDGDVLAENIDIVAGSGGRALLFRNIANVTMDLNDVERIELEALEGADNITVSDLTGTDVKLVSIDLSAELGNDLAKDTVTVSGTNGNDKVQVTSPFGSVLITGLASQVGISGTEASKDSVTINGFGGNDAIDASKFAAGIIPLTLDGGGGNDILTGGAGPDVLFGRDGNDKLGGGAGVDTLDGGSGNDTVTGGQANDVAFLGLGNDLFLWSLGDGGDIVEGEGDIDTVRFTGGNAGDAFNVKANSGKASIVTSDGAVLDANDVERIEIRTLGGGDAVFVQDLTGTDVKEVAIDLAATAGGVAADAVNDGIAINSSFAATMVVTSAGSKMVVTNNASGQIVSVDHWGTTDVLALTGSDGADVLDASLVPAGKMNLRLFGGLGVDVMRGGAGNDTVTGGDGSDAAFLGAGNDTFIWNPGDDSDTVEGQAGTDILQFNGANASETFDIQANGGRALLFGNVAGALVDMNDVERIAVAAGGGSDTIFVNDLAGTDVTQVAVDLAVLGGTADGVADIVTVAGTGGKDTITVALLAGAISVSGLPAKVTIAHADSIDTLRIDGDVGDDTISAATLKASAGRLSVDGGDGNDKITGGLSNDVLFGGADNDKLLGGSGDDNLLGETGNDTLDGGAGNDVLQGGEGKDVLTGGVGNDSLVGGQGDDTITGGTGGDIIYYTSVLDGHDVVVDFDGNAVGGQDVVDLDGLFDALGVAGANREARVLVLDKGASVDITVDADGSLANGFELVVATLKTVDVITVGPDIFVGG